MIWITAKYRSGPPDKGKGLDGVVRLADGAYNPALELLEGVPAGV